MQLTSLNDITKKYRHIFLAPHFDDIVYSCGGTLGVQVSSGLRPLVITVFGGIPSADAPLSPLASQLHQQMGLCNAPGSIAPVEARRKEDASALNYLEVDYLWLDYLEASYRGTPTYYTRIEEILGGDIHPSDQWIDKQLAQDLLTVQEKLPDAVWYAPLGVGRHVDHQLVCSAADRLAQRSAKVYFYEDFPYAVREEGALKARLNELGGALEPKLVEMSEFLPARLAASDMYATQIESNFANQQAMHEAMEKYTHSIRPVETVYLERYWSTR